MDLLTSWSVEGGIAHRIHSLSAVIIRHHRQHSQNHHQRPGLQPQLMRWHSAWLERVAPGCTSRFDVYDEMERAFASDGDDEDLHDAMERAFAESDSSYELDEAAIMDGDEEAAVMDSDA